MLSDRKFKILQAIINDFLESAQPVGSRTVSRKYLIGTSPATIRNDMADLEELGFLFQPHVSAGRVPSDLGYRFFVEQMIDFGMPNHSFYSRLMPLLKDGGADTLEKTVELLAEKTGSIAMICMPEFGHANLENLKLIKVYKNKAIMIIVAGEGNVRYLEIQSDLNQAELDDASKVLLDNFAGKSVEDIDIRAVRKLKIPELEYFIPSLREALKTVKGTDIKMSSAKWLLESDDVVSADELKSLLAYLDDNENLSESIRDILNTRKGRLGIRIGSELHEDALKNYSVICSEFGIRNEDRGFIGIIGPKRMDYEANGNLVAGCATALTEAFSGIYL